MRTRMRNVATKRQRTGPKDTHTHTHISVKLSGHSDSLEALEETVPPHCGSRYLMKGFGLSSLDDDLEDLDAAVDVPCWS